MRLRSSERSVQYGIAGSKVEPPFAILAAGERAEVPSESFHAFAAPSRAAVDAFHAAAMVHGAIDDGPPGPRPAYGPGYYAAFVIDPDGHRVEAVVHEPI